MPKKLRVACFHGYGTNGKFLSNQMKSFQRAFAKEIQFIFLQGTVQVPVSSIIDEKVIALVKGTEIRSWNPFPSYKYRNEQYFEALVTPMEKYFKDQQYDGLIGFSQGADFLKFLIKLCKYGKISWKGIKSLKFCIIASGGHWNWYQNDFPTNQQLQIPSIHLLSESDFLYHKSIFTTIQFKDSIVLHHMFGHSFPQLGREQLKLIQKFISNACKTGEQNEELIVNKL